MVTCYSAERVSGENSLLDRLAVEKRRLTDRLETLESATYKPIDPDAVLRSGMASLRDLPRLLETGTIEERKEFVRAFVVGVTVQPDDVRLDVQMRQIPKLGTGNSTCEMVAGARYEPVQMNLEPAERFVAGLRLVA